MKCRRCFVNRRWDGAASVIAIFVITIFLIFCDDANAAFFEKQYLVKEIQGKEVLCDPYVVQKDDWILRLFRQRGEIAHEDFPKFLQMFKIINPGVGDIDTIYPGQKIFIPLRILPPGSFDGQDSGMVTLPVINITNLPEIISNQSTQYIIQYGDWVSRLIAQRFGAIGTESYDRGVKSFKALNPEIADINIVLAGQIVRLPDPDDVELTLHAKVSDEKEELIDLSDFTISSADDYHIAAAQVTANKTQRSGHSDSASKSEATGKSGVIESIEPEESQTRGIKAFSSQSSIVESMRGFSDQSVFVKAGRILDADVISSGKYYFPRQGKPDFSLILSETPLMRFRDGTSLLFTKRQWLSVENQHIVELYWPDIKIVFFESDTQLKSLISTIIPVIDPGGDYAGHLNLTHGDIKIAVRGQYIYTPAGRQSRMVCLNILEKPEMRIPQTIRDYLGIMGVTVREWIEAESMSGWAESMDTGYRVPEVRRISTNSPEFFVKNLIRELGYRYQKDVDVSFPYAGFQVNASAGMLSLDNGSNILMDYGDFDGNAIASIEKTGLRIIQVDKSSSPGNLVDLLSQLLPLEFTANPVFWTSARPRLYNPSIQIPGYLIYRRSEEQSLSAEEIERQLENERLEEIARQWGAVRYVDPENRPDEKRRTEAPPKEKKQDYKLLVSMVPIPEEVASYLHESGIRLIEVADFNRPLHGRRVQRQQ